MVISTTITIAQILGIVGIPSVATIIVFLFRQGKKINILMRAVQAQMREHLMWEYHMYMERGYITDIELKEWDNQYIAYHCLGANGVLDSKRDDLIRLPAHI